MIPEQFKTEVIQTGISFMRSITEAFGPDEGLKLWDTIASTLDPDIKGQIFFAMITGAYTTEIVITGYSLGKVDAIRAIRAVTGLPLKEAKEVTDKLDIFGQQVKLKISDPTKRGEAISVLRSAGVRL